ncbi:host-nuclease inhibitor Gam family protein [Conchiformibius steedae]|uniref:Host-nuclease inhibitor protein Gam n=1 Tax=Conchiformibius steedae TaxID=153493 RepID=A0A3P2A762_9NEIS|nr:host-nuclease inhibitor Gam family protein [Conchiformibius steedae]RRD90090.1 host-nuclease inhibitor protein Gam [Conchiformibius steedae]
MSKTRVKTAALSNQSKQDIIDAIKQIGDISREVKRQEAEMNDGIAALQQQYAEATAPLNAQMEELQKTVQVWCEANRDALTDNGSVKSADLVTGTVKWRNNPPSVRVTGTAAVLALLKANPDLERFVRVKEEVNKDAVLNERDKFDSGQVPGLKIVEGREYFVIEPHDQDLSHV